jgi:PncC family amidohydrolase
VSREVAEAMATGMREKSGADIALSITGIAGPDGGSEEKPVGTVFVGIANAEGVRVRHLLLPGTRYEIQRMTAQTALDLLRRYLLK